MESNSHQDDFYLERPFARTGILVDTEKWIESEWIINIDNDV